MKIIYIYILFKYNNIFTYQIFFEYSKKLVRIFIIYFTYNNFLKICGIIIYNILLSIAFV